VPGVPGPLLPCSPAAQPLALSPLAVANHGAQPPARDVGEGLLPTKPPKRARCTRLIWHSSCVVLSCNAEGEKSTFFPSGSAELRAQPPTRVGRDTSSMLPLPRTNPCVFLCTTLLSSPLPSPCKCPSQPHNPSQRTGLKKAEKSAHGDMHRWPRCRTSPEIRQNTEFRASARFFLFRKTRAFIHATILQHLA